jgi:uncharacterized protein YdcH (DUF465 family)
MPNTAGQWDNLADTISTSSRDYGNLALGVAKFQSEDALRQKQMEKEQFAIDEYKRQNARFNTPVTLNELSRVFKPEGNLTPQGAVLGSELLQTLGWNPAKPDDPNPNQGLVKKDGSIVTYRDIAENSNVFGQYVAANTNTANLMIDKLGQTKNALKQKYQTTITSPGNELMPNEIAELSKVNDPEAKKLLEQYGTVQKNIEHIRNNPQITIEADLSRLRNIEAFLKDKPGTDLSIVQEKIKHLETERDKVKLPEQIRNKLGMGDMQPVTEDILRQGMSTMGGVINQESANQSAEKRNAADITSREKIAQINAAAQLAASNHANKENLQINARLKMSELYQESDKKWDDQVGIAPEQKEAGKQRDRRALEQQLIDAGVYSKLGITNSTFGANLAGTANINKFLSDTNQIKGLISGGSGVEQDELVQGYIDGVNKAAALLKTGDPKNIKAAFTWVEQAKKNAQVLANWRKEQTAKKLSTVGKNSAKIKPRGLTAYQQGTMYDTPAY